MSSQRPADAGRTQDVSLEAAAGYLLEECRMVLPGIQTLFGFQLIAVFSETFNSLSNAQQSIHLGAIVLVVIAVALVMAPAALHRQVQPQKVSERFIWLASKLLLASMFPLVAGICLDAYVVASVITSDARASIAVGALLLAVFALLWFVLPQRERHRGMKAAIGNKSR